jgi:hypothetical protein
MRGQTKLEHICQLFDLNADRHFGEPHPSPTCRSWYFVVGVRVSILIDRYKRNAMLDPKDDDIDPDQQIDRQTSIFENPNCSALH